MCRCLRLKLVPGWRYLKQQKRTDGVTLDSFPCRSSNYGLFAQAFDFLYLPPSFSYIMLVNHSRIHPDTISTASLIQFLVSSSLSVIYISDNFTHFHYDSSLCFCSFCVLLRYSELPVLVSYTYRLLLFFFGLCLTEH